MAASTQTQADPAAGRSGAGRLFDLRYLIGGLFTVYGVVLAVASFFVGHAKSGNIDINLWLGLAMLLLGVFFLVWAVTRPLRLDPRPTMAAREQHDAVRRDAAADAERRSDFASRVDGTRPPRRRRRRKARR